MSPQLRRYAPLIAIALLLFILLPLLNRGHKSGISSGDKSDATKRAMGLLDSGEKTYRAAKGRYTDHLADLVATSKGLAGTLAIGLFVQLDVSSNGQTYVAQLSSDVLSLVRVRAGDKVTTDTCRVLKKGSGVNCDPLTPAKKAPSKP
jgi:hypothetical protein